MGQGSSSGIDESTLTKGQVRKLRALRKSVGEEIGEQAFAAWLSSQSGAGEEKADGTRRRSSTRCGRWSSRAPWRSRAAATSSDAGAEGSSWSRRGRRSSDGIPSGPITVLPPGQPRTVPDRDGDVRRLAALGATSAGARPRGQFRLSTPARLWQMARRYGSRGSGPSAPGAGRPVPGAPPDRRGGFDIGVGVTVS